MMSISWIKRKSLKKSTSKSTLVVDGTRPNVVLLLSIAALFIGMGVFVVQHSRATDDANISVSSPAAQSQHQNPSSDLNKDGQVNTLDLSGLLSKWGTSDSAYDLNHDGSVNSLDLSQLLGHWTD